MRKLIDIPEDIYKGIQYLSIDEGTNPKNWIEDLLASEVKKKSKQIKVIPDTKT